MMENEFSIGFHSFSFLTYQSKSYVIVNEVFCNIEEAK